jgi:hypothetical protein
LDVPAVSLSRHNSSTQLPSELPAELLSSPLVWVCRGGIIPPLQPFYDGPNAVLRRRSRSFTIQVGSGTRSFPSAASRPAQQWTPSLAARVAVADRWVRAQAVLPQPSGSHFRTYWYLHLPLQCCLETVPERFSYPARRFSTPRTSGAITGATDEVPIQSTGNRHRDWTFDLFSFQPRPELGGSPWTPAYTSGRWSDPSGVLQ